MPYMTKPKKAAAQARPAIDPPKETRTRKETEPYERSRPLNPDRELAATPKTTPKESVMAYKQPNPPKSEKARLDPLHNPTMKPLNTLKSTILL